MTLWPHQEQMVCFAIDNLNTRGYTWWLAGCATGKTLSALTVMQRMGLRRTLVLTTKAAAVSAWPDEIEKWMPNVHYEVPVGKSLKHRLAALERNPQVYVINYESAWRGGLLSALQRHGFELVIADESHKLKAHNSKQGVKLSKLAESIPYKIAMTGTAWDDRPTDIFGQARWLQKGLFRNWGAFFERYVSYYQTPEKVKIPTGYKNQQELAEKIAPFTIRVDSEEVLELPPEMHIERRVAMPRKISLLYKDLKYEGMAEYNGEVITPDNALVRSLRLHQLTCGYFNTELGDVVEVLYPKDNPKIQMTLDILDEIGDKPVVIFTRFTQDVKALQMALPHSTKVLVGGLHQHREWQRGDGQVLIANIQAGSEGIDLTRARYCIYYSIGFSRTNYNQSKYRVRRKGSDLNYPITYYHILMEDSIDITMRKALEGKGEVADYLIQYIGKAKNELYTF